MRSAYSPMPGAKVIRAPRVAASLSSSRSSSRGERGVFQLGARRFSSGVCRDFSARSRRTLPARRSVVKVRSEKEGNGAEKEYVPGVELCDVPFKKILCANRGEIAIRVFRAADELGIKSVAIYSPADRLQQHRFKADESYCVGTEDMKPVDCYLDIEAILKLAKEVDVDAIHPGYGFLSENTTFARRCAEEGITFIGPDPETILSMGDKTAARRAAGECNVPVVPGTDNPIESAAAAAEFAETAGYPIMLKAAMGGGGRGMRIVRSARELDDAFTRASSEAKSAFGDGRMFAEKLVEEPRHIEVQILADTHGNVMHLYERDCSVQRRHQKVVEIAPSSGLPEKTRAALFEDSVKLCKYVGYKNAGTVEFMVDKNGDYYFLEVNPRIQVEHTVTEEITGVDLVQKQIYIAGGASLEECGLPPQDRLPEPNGFAIQCRVTSEDPLENFKPDSGRLEAFRVPGGPGVRLDGAVITGNVISRYYDSLICKVICWAPTFPKAVQKMQRALNEFQVRGIKTNIPFLSRVCVHPEFLGGAGTTAFMERNWDDLVPPGGEKKIGKSRRTRVLTYLADMVVNGPDHPGAVGPPPADYVPSPASIPEDLLDTPLTGWRDILEKEGPDAWAKAVREHKGVLLTDTTWRDAHQSLLATRMRTHDLLKAAPASAQILKECASLEMWGGATFDVAMRFLHECPWKRLELLREQVPNIPFQMLLRGASAVGYTSYPDNVVKEFIREARKSGMDIFRIFDSLNYLENLKFGIDEVRAAGGVAEGTICYTGDVSSKDPGTYTLEYYLELAEALVEQGIHCLAVKDMAGLLRPRAATMLVSALRKEFPDLPLHIHTHDSAGTGVATQLACAAAGADIVDSCIDSMSGFTSQPSMGAIVAALEGTELDTGVNLEHIGGLNQFWEHTRGLYAPFECGLKSTSSDVYSHEMPGGQYTNLKFQATSLGLGDEWDKIKTAYAAANRALGDIVKVTPSSKVVGDLAQFMVQNNLDEHSLLEQADQLSFPNSVVELLQGYLGQPPNGFPEPLRSRVVKDKKTVVDRPGKSLPPMDLYKLQLQLENKWDANNIDAKNVMSAALYPKVYEDYMKWRQNFGAGVALLPTRAFLAPLKEDEELELELAKGVVATIKYKATGELQPGGKREVFFEANGVPRAVEVVDRKYATEKRAIREKAIPGDIGSVGAPMAGDVVEVSVAPGTKVKAGQELVVMSAMKMETAVCAPSEGVVSHVAIDKGDILDAGDLLVKITSSSQAVVAASAPSGNGSTVPAPAKTA
ncbi:hypothetical protein BSKO_04540 [Bryopsis sp. KO-2023]|nr:hypothetical protein BSKO_04540 [Bryopsis sp. KO-2023]